MRPDYTLSIWPDGFNEEEAEVQEIIIHIHFDAKYKVAGYKEIFSKKEIDESDDKADIENIENKNSSEKRAIYKRVDLLKMHAYKDAIRRTAGAYVLYPGTEKTVKQGFHEIIPGLGAFAVRPSKDNTGISMLSNFIKDVLDNFMMQTSNHERLSYHKYDIYKNAGTLKLKEATPEKYGDYRSKPPNEISVLIGYVQEKQKDWIKKNNKYNIRFDRPITPEMVGAEYIVLYDKDTVSGRIFRVIDNPVIVSASGLRDLGYPDSGKEVYFVYQIEDVNNSYLEDKKWDISKLSEYHNEAKYRPFTVSLAELMDVIV